MGYFWLNSNSKLRASLSLQFESLTKSCEQVEVDVVHSWEWNVCLVLCMSSDAFNGRSMPSWWFLRTSSSGTTMIQPRRRYDPLRLLTTVIINDLWVSNKMDTSKIKMILSLCVYCWKPTFFPVPGFQWYPNTSSRLTVLLLSTSFSSSSWGKCAYFFF